MSPSDKNIAWNNCFRRIFTGCFKRAEALLFNSNTIPASLTVDQRKMIILCHSGNIVLQTVVD